MNNNHKKLFPVVNKLPTYRSHCHLIEHRFKSHNPINIQGITMISIKTTENNDDSGHQYRSVICFRHHGSLPEFVCELFPIT